MIGGEQKVPSLSTPTLRIDEAAVAFPEFTIFEWDTDEAYFWSYGKARDVQRHPAQTLIIVRYVQPVDPTGGWVLPENQRVIVTPEQEILDAQGRWIEALDLRDGSVLQHFCGNGHTAVVKSMMPLREDDAYDFECTQFGTFMASGLILKGRGPCLKERASTTS